MTPIGRRAFLASAAMALAAGPAGALAQRPARRLRLGILANHYQRNTRLTDAFFATLRELGYVERDNLVVLVRDVEGRQERFPPLAAELVALKPDVILASSTPAARAALGATSSIPIVFVGDPDPVASGLVASLARPGGNVTGISNLGNEVFGKRLELLKLAVPRVRRIAYLWQRGVFPDAVEAAMIERTSAEAQTLGLELVFVETGPADLHRAFEAMGAPRPDALVLNNPSPVLFSERRRIAELATARKLPTMGPNREFAADGGLMAYGPDFVASFRRAAAYVDRIAKGASPVELAVERATKLELVVNLVAAAAIGIALPASLLARADDILR